MQNQDQSQKLQTVVEQQQQEPEAPIYMFYTYMDTNTGQPAMAMSPQYFQYWTDFMENIYVLRETVNKKWKPEEVSAYQLFLNDLQSYIVNYIYTGMVQDYNFFANAMDEYGENRNKIGFDLYNNQCDYLAKKESGYDFTLDKKQKKEKKKTQQTKAVKPRQQKKEEEVIVRKDDPTTTAEQLKAKTWQPNKYANMDSFHLESANLIFIGHVDSGKSTLTGNIMKELKLVDEQQLTKNKQQAKQKHMESWELAYIADFDPSERIKGKTLECSKMMFTLPNRRFTLFDAPGHKNYVPSMIMGACQADIAVLIISSKEGQFQSGFEKDGQTKQHAMLAKALGVQSLIAAVTKMGTVDWSEARFNHIRQQVSPFLENSCGFKGVHFVPLDSINNANIHSRYTQSSWYKGPCLMQQLQEVKVQARDPDGPLRIPIIDKFKDVGQFFVYGKLQSGKIAYQGQVVSLLPKRQYVSIKQIYNARDQKLPYALAGENVKLRIKGIDENQIHRGFILCSNNNYCQQSLEFKATISVLDLPEQKKIMSSGYECILHLHAIVQEAQIALVQGKVDKQTGKSMKATYLLPGQQGKIVIKLKNSICLQKFDFMPSLGRFTLRDEGKTIGYGEVTKIKPAKTLTKQQKDQLGIKSQETGLAAELDKVKIEQQKPQN